MWGELLEETDQLTHFLAPELCPAAHGNVEVTTLVAHTSPLPVEQVYNGDLISPRLIGGELVNQLAGGTHPFAQGSSQLQLAVGDVAAEGDQIHLWGRLQRRPSAL
jgi:hypothetical protein